MIDGSIGSVNNKEGSDGYIVDEQNQFHATLSIETHGWSEFESVPQQCNTRRPSISIRCGTLRKLTHICCALYFDPLSNKES